MGGWRPLGQSWEAIRTSISLLLLAGAAGSCFVQETSAGSPPNEPDGSERSFSPDPARQSRVDQFVNEYCLECHNGVDQAGSLDLEQLSLARLGESSADWERVVHKLRTRQMPPADAWRPSEAEYEAALGALTTSLDRAAQEHPTPGRTSTFRRLNRTEYKNAIGDLLALEIDATKLLPADDSSHGFDNVTIGNLSPTLLNRYISAAQKIARRAVGGTGRSPGGKTIRIPADRTQERHVEGLPMGTRGGTLISHHFPRSGEYEIQIRLARDRNEEIEGLNEPHQLELLLDRRKVARFTVKPPDGRNFDAVDEKLKTRFSVTAGPHQLGVTFLKKPWSLLETKRQPFDAHFNMYRHPRISPAIYQISITGPYHDEGAGDTPSRRRIFVCRPSGPDEAEACAKRILTRLARRAYRRPVTDEDLKKPMEFYRQGRAEGGDFDAGIETALSSILVNPHFLFRIERAPKQIEPNTPYQISDVELASRLSFFLWSSIPDDELLRLAEQGRLSDPEVLEQQVRRMLEDSRSQNLVTNFAGQWLYLRNLESTTPNLRKFPNFDDNLRQAFRRETELLFENVLRKDRSVLELLSADYTYLNERLAEHYRIPHIYGSRFRRVNTGENYPRGGLLRHGSILTVTSYATRTSPVIRGHWILENIVGAPPPPPPPDVPALEENTVAANLSVRERLLEHRANPACASCHNLMDPVGFALENFDAVGHWRDVEAGRPIDASGGLPDGSEFTGVAGLEQGLLRRPEWFVQTLTEKLLTFALGRGVEPYDAPAIRKIVRHAREQDYRFSSLIVGIANSTPFQMRTSQ